MHWNFRVVDHKHRLGGKWHRWSSIEEVYYEDESDGISHTSGLGVSSEEGRPGVIETLKMMLKDAKRAPSVPCRCDVDERKKPANQGKSRL